MLFAGGTVDSTEQASPWIPIRGANRIVIRSWSTHAAFSPSGDDSAFSDSIATWRTAFTDSVIKTNPLVGVADSVVFTGGFQDSATVLMGLDNPAVNVQLRGATNGAGFITQMFAVAPNGVATYGDGQMNKDYMMILITPLRRNISPAAIGRVNGLQGFRMCQL